MPRDLLSDIPQNLPAPVERPPVDLLAAQPRSPVDLLADSKPEASPWYSKENLAYGIQTALDVPASIAVGMGTMAFGGLKGIIEAKRAQGEEDIIFQPESGKAFMDEIEKAGQISETFRETTTPAAQKALGVIEKPLEWVETASKFYGDMAFEKTGNPNLAALVKTGVDMTAFFGLPALLGKLIKTVKQRKVTEQAVQEVLKEIKETPETKQLREEFQKEFVKQEAETQKTNIIEEIKKDLEAPKEITDPIIEKLPVDLLVKELKPPVEGIAKPSLKKLDIKVLGRKSNAIEAANILPSPQEGNIRLFRASSPTVKFQDIFKKEGLKEFYLKGKKGDFYTSDIAYADYFRDAYGKDAIIKWIDVPKKFAEKRIGKTEYEYVIDPKEIELISESTQKKAPEPKKQKEMADSKKGTTLYGGLPIKQIAEIAEKPFLKAGELYQKSVGHFLWDYMLKKKGTQILEKTPILKKAGKPILRAIDREYRGDLPKSGEFIKSMDERSRVQAIGRDYALDLGNRLSVIPESRQLLIAEKIKGGNPKMSKAETALAQEAIDTLYDLGRQAVDVGLLSEKVFFENAGRYMPRLYTKHEFTSLLDRWKVGKPDRMDLSRFQKRKDIPKEIRKEMGEILTPGYPVAKGIMQMTHDIALAKQFKGIASNPEWAIAKTPVLTAAGKQKYIKTSYFDSLTGKKIEQLKPKMDFQKDIPADFKQLPKNKKLSELSEAYVHPEIYNDLMEIIRKPTAGEKVWRKSLGYWKFGKVILSPKTHMRNVFSNGLLAHMGGMPLYEQPLYLARAAVELKKQGKTYLALKREGLLQSTFTQGELNTLLSGVDSQLKGLKAGGWMEATGIVGKTIEKARAGGRSAARLYELEEQWFKVAKAIHNMERRGMSVKGAAADAEKWLFNYSKLSKFQESYRSKWYGAPFATFTFKAIPRVIETGLKTPWRFALPMFMIHKLQQASMELIGDTPEQFKAKQKLRPEWMQGQFLGMPNFARVPIIDDFEREYFLNLTYMTPWGDIGEGGGVGPIPGGLMPFSMPVLKEGVQQAFDYDLFWKEPIIKEKDIAGLSESEKNRIIFKTRLKHFYHTIVPTIGIDIEKAYAASKKLPDYKGRNRLGSVVLADILGGIKMYPVDYVDQTVRYISKNNPNQSKLANEIKWDIKKFTKQRNTFKESEPQYEFYDKKISRKIKQLQGLGKDVVQFTKISKTARGVK